jgi:drug/metabolite transporter (DMT)-like permease
MHSRPPASAYAAAVGMTVAFGLSFVATKYALRGFEPLLLALLRFALAGGILWVVWRFRRGPERVSRGELGRLAVLGFVSLTVYFSFENLGIARTSASEAAILIATIPLFVVILNTFTLREHNTARQGAGIALCFAGIAALVLLGGSGAGGGSLTGNLLVLAASLSAGVYSILARRLGVRHPTPRASGGLLFLTVVCSITAYLLLNYAFRFIPASKVAVFINLTPIVAVASAYVLLGERFTPGQAAAAVVVVAGVWLTNSGGGAARSPSAG